MDKELQRCGIQTITLTRGLWAVGKYVAQMAVATPAANFCAYHTVALIDDVADMVRIKWFKKAGPTSAGFELSRGAKQRQPAKPARINAVFFVVQ